MAAVAAFLLMGDIKIVVGMSSLGTLLVFGTINIAVIVLRFKVSDEKRHLLAIVIEIILDCFPDKIQKEEISAEKEKDLFKH